MRCVKNGGKGPSKPNYTADDDTPLSLIPVALLRRSRRTDITKRIRYCGTMIERLHQGVVSGGVGEGRGASTATNANKSLSYSSQNNDDGSKTKGRRTSRRRMKEVGA